MKNKFLALIGAAMFLLAGSSAHATSSNVINPETELNLQTGEIYTYSTIYSSRFNSTDISGFLPEKSRVTFDYSLTGGKLTGLGLQVSSDAGDYFYGPYVDVNSILPKLNDVSGPLLISLSGLTVISGSSDIQRTGQLIITNYSNAVVGFGANFFAALTGKSSFDLTASVSAVPLPAALPLFGLGLASLIGVRIKRRKA